MKPAKALTTVVLQLALVGFLSMVASYVFIRTIEIAYGISLTTLQLLFALVLVIGVLIGTVIVLIVPGNTGGGFFIFLVILLLPAILAESRVSGFLIAQSGNNFPRYEVYVSTIAVIGGYFCLRHLALSNQTRSELFARGGSEESLNQAAKWGGYITGLTVLGAIAIVFALTVGAPVLANALQPNPITWLPFYFYTLLGTAVGVMIMVTLYFYQRLLGEKLQIPLKPREPSKGDFKGMEGVRKQLSIIEERLKEFIERGKP